MEIQEIALERIGMDLERLRLIDPKAQERMTESIRTYGQLSPVLAGWFDTTVVLVDGFKRLRALQMLKYERLRVCTVVCPIPALKAMVLTVHHKESPCREFEEALIVQSLHRDDGLQQQEIALLCNRHKSWVCRRIGLIERLSDEVQEQLRLGLVTMAVARELLRLPRGNQKEALDRLRSHRLSSRQSRQWVSEYLARPVWQRSELLNNPNLPCSGAKQRHIKCGSFTSAADGLIRHSRMLDNLFIKSGIGALTHEQCTELQRVIRRVGTRCAHHDATLTSHLRSAS